ncbi:hypothetical protein [Dellaglioa algida]|nr:hypothetical protein [Dellaglioa algida]MDK1727227.1 hypothetical protein [Dellaglioa algida]
MTRRALIAGMTTLIGLIAGIMMGKIAVATLIGLAVGITVDQFLPNKK